MGKKIDSSPVGPRNRPAALRQLRRLKMARSAHAFVRGSTEQFYAWLKTRAPGAIPEGPAIWICGDCHIGNIGPVGSASGEIEIQIRDLDQAVIGNPAHDLIRLGLSLAMSIRSSDLPGVTTALMVEAMMLGYEHALSHPRTDLSGVRPEAIHVVMRDALRRRWKQLANERIENPDPGIPLGRRFWPVSLVEKRAIGELFSRPEILSLLTSVWSRDDDASVTILDQAFWVKGCSSLGLLRFAVLVRVGKRGSKQEQFGLVDIKQAVTALAPRARSSSMPRGHSLRVVHGARALSPHLGDRMASTRLLDRDVFVRELFPQDLKIELDILPREEVAQIARYLAWVVGRAHARQLAPSQREAWRRQLQTSRKRDLEAPSWLWTSIAELAGQHETAYLEHCRRFSLDAGSRRSFERT